MNRSEFTSLPLSLALGLLWDAAQDADRITTARYLEDAEAPKPARPPRFDSAIYRRDGITWASEYDAEGLRYWRDKNAAGAENGGEYAEKNAKAAKALGYFLEWREQNPSAIWTGERNREQVTAKAPMAKPEVYPRTGAPRAAAPAATGGGGFSDADYGSDGDDGDIPFVRNVTNEAKERWWK